MARPERISTDPDSDLLELVAKQDMTTALRLLMQRHGTPIYRYCREALRDATLAEDVHQQVFIEACRDLPKFQYRSTVRTWLFAIARHRVLDAARSRVRSVSHIGSDDATAVADLRPSPADLLDDERLRDLLRACLETLRAAVRTAVLLRFQQGFTFEEMAGVCEELPGTLQAQVTRALPALRRCIEQRVGAAQ